jgi:hypothetical protein
VGTTHCLSLREQGFHHVLMTLRQYPFRNRMGGSAGVNNAAHEVPSIDSSRERNMAIQSQHASFNGPQRKPQDDIETADSISQLPSGGIDNPEANDFERSQEEAPIDDPGDAQHSSKSEPDGDGEEQDR